MSTKTVLATIALAAIGFGAALLAFPRIASAWDYGSLPSGCSQGGTQYDSTGPNYAYKVSCSGVLSGWMHYGSNPYPQAATDPAFQGNLDAFVDAHYTAPVTTTAQTTTSASTTTTAPTTTAVTTTATTPATTTDTTATTTVAAPAVTTTVTVTDTTTTTAVTTTTDPTIEARIAALEAEYIALSKRVTAIQEANAASWDAFIAASQAGASPADAALAARSAGTNALYLLGA